MTALRELAGTTWSGRAELWVDPLGNEVDACDCRIEVEADHLEYHWSYEGKPHVGRVVFRPGGADFTDSWHSESVMVCVTAPSPWAMIDVLGTYDGGEGSEWGWRILLALRPSDELVLQMTNVTPWGEEGRAVRMICSRE